MRNNLYCTYFNSGYIDRAVILLRSLERFDPGFKMDILCYDDAAVEFFSKNAFHGVSTIHIRDLEAMFPEITKVKSTRSLAEYMFTNMSFLLVDELHRHPDVELVSYVDCDTQFFDSPSPMFAGMVGHDIMLSPHRFSRCPEKANEYGYYNAGFMVVRNNDNTKKILKTWCDQCLEWCYDHHEDGKFAHQLYLNAWPANYGNAICEVPITVNLTPWGVKPGSFSVKQGKPYINGEPIVQYHYQGVRLYSIRQYYVGHCFHQNIVTILQCLYEPYVKSLFAVQKEFGLTAKYGNVRHSTGGMVKKLATGYWLGHPHISEMIRWVQRLAR